MISPALVVNYQLTPFPASLYS